MRKELFWDRDKCRINPETEIERAINFGGFEYIANIQKKYGIEKFIDVLMKNRNLSKRAVNYWCLVLTIDRARAAVFRDSNKIWSPFK